MFSDYKTRGFNLEDSQIERTDRLDRLVLVLSLALYWAVSSGMGDAMENKTPAEKKTRQRSANVRSAPLARVDMPMPETEFDPKAYLNHFEDCDISETEKIECIKALWLIAQSFANHAFGLTAALPEVSAHARKTGVVHRENGIVSSKFIPPAEAPNDNTHPMLKNGTSQS